MNPVYDVIILGAGPAGFTAGTYASRASMKTLLIEATGSLSQITYADHVENYPGFPEGISGFDLNERFRRQAVHFGLEIVSGDVAGLQALRPTQPDRAEQPKHMDMWEVRTSDSVYRSLSCIIATGASWKKLGIPGEEDMIGKGVSYCATCDAPFYRDKDVGVIGGGDTAVGEAIYLTRFARKVTVFHRRERLRACGLLQTRAFENKKIEFVWDAVPERIIGENAVSGYWISKSGTPKQSRDIPLDGVFILVGLNPNTGFVCGMVRMDENGYILVNDNMETSAKGLFACGDCIHKSLRQVVTACGDGATAAYSAQIYTEECKGATD